MWPNLQETADLVTFTEEILNGKLHILCSETITYSCSVSENLQKNQSSNAVFLKDCTFPLNTSFISVFMTLANICRSVKLINGYSGGRYWSPGLPPPTSPGHPLKDPIWPSGDVPNCRPVDVPIWRPGNVSKWRPGGVIIWCPRDIAGTFIGDVTRKFLGRLQEDLENTSYGRCGVTCWMSLNFFLLFFRNLFYWPNIYKSNSILKVYLGPTRSSKMELFPEIS